MFVGDRIRLDSGAGKGADAVGLVGPVGGKFIIRGIVVVGVIEAGGDGATEESEPAVADEAHALPDSGGDENLDVLGGEQIVSKGEESRAAIGVEVEHFDGIAEVEVEHLVGVEEVQLGELACLEEVVNGGGLRACAAGGFDGGG